MPGPTGLARRAAGGLAGLPGLRWVALRGYRRYFASQSGAARLFMGVYPSFEAAAASAPCDKPLGFDNPATAHRLEHERHALDPTDYPVLFWLSRLLRPDSFVFDVGANVAISYYKYRNYLDFQPGLTWLAQDVPAVVAAGEAIAAAEPSPGLRYTHNFTEVGRADIVLACGCLQFLRDPLEFLRDAERRPFHIILNKTPAQQRHPAAVTLHSTGTAYCPYWLFNWDDLLVRFGTLGYEPVDVWTNPGLSCRIPFFHGYSVSTYSGALFAACV
jgi:putative methyltransferase (TIGR04325 family)